MSTARRAVRTSGLVLVGQLFSRGASAGVFFGMARLLSRAELGRFSFVLAYISLFQVLGDLGVQQIVVREVARGRTDRARVVFNAVLVRLVLSLGSSALLLAILPLVHEGPVPGDVRFMVACGCLWIVANAFLPAGAVFRASMNMNAPVLANGIGNVSYLALAMMAMLVARKAWPVWTCLVVTSIAPAVVIATLGARRLAPEAVPSPALVREVLGSSWPLALNSILMVIYNRIDQVMIRAFLGEEQLGLYASAVKLMEGWNMIPYAVMTSIFPLLSRYAGQDDVRHRDVVKRTLRVLVMVIVAAVPFVWRYGEALLELIYGKGFGAAHRALSILITGELFLYFLYVFRDAFASERRERLVLLFAGSTMFSNVVLCAILIPRFGIEGAAWATLMALAGVLVLAVALPQARVYGWLALGALARPALAAGMSGFVLWRWSDRPVLSFAGAAIAYGVTLLVLGAVERRDLDLLRQALGRRSTPVRPADE